MSSLDIEPINKNPYDNYRKGFSTISIIMADRTGLEPATSGVTGRHSNQLNYRSAAVINQTFKFNLWSLC